MLANITVVVGLLVASVVFRRVGNYAESRGVERMPERKLSYGVKDLSEIACASREYVVPILFPLDLIVMILIAASLGWAAVQWGPHAIFLHGRTTVEFLIFPLAYLATDLAEDSFLALLLTHRPCIATPTVLMLKTLTALKFAALSLAVAVVALGPATVLGRYLIDIGCALYSYLSG